MRRWKAVAATLQPPKRITPDEWGALNRRYPVGHDRPGPRDPFLTPYMVPFARSVASRAYRKVVMVTFAQAGKSDALCDVIGHRFDQAPAPTLYIGPNKQFLNEQFEPRLMRLLDEAPKLAAKVARGKRMTKTRKVIGGMALRLAHAGSSTALKSDPIALALTDEADELMANVKGQGDPIGLIDRRGDTFADFVHGIVSTPSVGIAEIEVDPETGLEFWKTADPKSIESTIWRLWQSGTRRHFAWPCPQCADWFIPRMKLLHFPESAGPSEAKATAFVACPRCGGAIEDYHKPEMNRRGVYVAPGQRIEADGTLTGEVLASLTDSYWVSGLCSPFRTFGDQAAELAEARLANDPDRLQTVTTAVFGELVSPFAGGEGITATDVRNKALPYRLGQGPNEVVRMVAGIDVQRLSLYYVVRGFGSRGASWLVDCGQLFGPTDDEGLHGVWSQLSDVLISPHGGLHIELALIDSGFRPNKDEPGDVHKVYDFCRRHSWLVKAAKSWDSRSQPVIVKRFEVKPNGKTAPFSIELVHANSDFFKSMLFMRLRTAHGQPGSWYVPEDIPDEYCEQIASEIRTVDLKGKPFWREKHRHNHYLDCEALAQAAGYLLNVQRIPDGVSREGEDSLTTIAPDEMTVAPAVAARSLGLRERMKQRAEGIRRP